MSLTTTRRFALAAFMVAAGFGCDTDPAADADVDAVDASGEAGDATAYHYYGGPAVLPAGAPASDPAEVAEAEIAAVARWAKRAVPARRVASEVAERAAGELASATKEAVTEPSEAAEGGWDPEAWVGLVHDRAVVLVSGDGVEAGWASEGGQLRKVDAYERSWERPLNSAAIPASLEAWVGRPVRLYGADGKVCEARVGSLALRTVYRDVYADNPEDHDGDLAPREIATKYGHKLLVGVLDGWSDACKPSIYARSPMQPEPIVFRRTGDLRGRDARQALKAFRATAAWKEIARWNREGMNAPDGPWDEFLGNRAALRRHVNVTTGRELWEVRALHGPLCGDPGGNLLVLFEVTRAAGRRPALKPILQDQDWEGFKAFVDLDRDGTPELIDDMGDGIYRIDAQGHPKQLREVEVPDYGWSGCPC